VPVTRVDGTNEAGITASFCMDNRPCSSLGQPIRVLQ
jgi:hypothetical protein